MGFILEIPRVSLFVDLASDAGFLDVENFAGAIASVIAAEAGVPKIRAPRAGALDFDQVTFKCHFILLADGFDGGAEVVVGGNDVPGTGTGCGAACAIVRAGQ